MAIGLAYGYCSLVFRIRVLMSTRPPRSALRLAVGAAAFAIGAITLAACNSKNAYVPPPPPKVQVAQSLQRPVTLYLQLTGNTQAFNSVDLVARVQGYLAIDRLQGRRIRNQGNAALRHRARSVPDRSSIRRTRRWPPIRRRSSTIRRNISGKRRSPGRISPASR